MPRTEDGEKVLLERERERRRGERRGGGKDNAFVFFLIAIKVSFFSFF